MKNKKRNYIIILILSILILYLALKDNFNEKINYLLSFDIKWLLISFILMIIYWLFKGIALHYYIKKIDKNYSLLKGLHLILTTQLFHSITPFASGGQPWQIYKLKKDGLSLGESTNIIIQDFIAYQIALVLLGIIAVVSNNLLYIIPNNSKMRYLVIIGFTINILVITVLFIVAFSKKMNKKIIQKIINFLCKIKILKDKEKYLNKTEKFIKNFHNGAQLLIKDKFGFIKVILFNFIALTSEYLIPFTLMLGLNIYINPFYVIITSAYVMLIDSMIPTPGSTGGLEYGFISFFKNFIKGSKLSIIMIVWRIITYYFGIIVGTIAINIHKEDAI